MKKNTMIRLWLEGAVLLVLRVVQLRGGFDPDTGLALSGMGPGPLAGHALWIGLLLCGGAELFLSLRRPKGSKRSYACCFLPPEGPVPVLLAAGSFLLMAGGVLLLAGALPPQGTEAVTAAATGLLGIAGGAGLLLLFRELRGGGTPTTLPLLPAMFFSVLFLLAVYFPEESDPVLARFWLPVLAAALAAYFFYHLSGFLHGEGSLRWFRFTACMTAVACIAAAADCLRAPGRLLAYLGLAVTASAFLLLLREEPLPEPEKPDEKDA